MGGIIGGLFGSSAKTDRGAQLGGRQGLWNIFSYGLPMGEQGQATGQTDLNAAKTTLAAPEKYWQNLLTAGRTETAASSAPAVNAALAGSDAARRAEATSGTGRGGGTAALNREAGSSTSASIDNIINQNMVGGRTQAAQGLQSVAGQKAAIGSTELSNALQMLGLSEEAVNSIMSNATTSRQISDAIHQREVQGYGQALGTILANFFMPKAA